MNRKKLIILSSITLVLIGLVVTIFFIFLNNSEEITEEEMPEILLGMKLGGDFHEQIQIAKNNGMVQVMDSYFYLLDKKSIYPHGYSNAIEAQILPKFIFDGTDSILVNVDVYYYTKDKGPFLRVINNSKHFLLPINLDSIPYRELLTMEENDIIRSVNYYYLYANDVDDLITTLESKYGKLKKVNRYVNIFDDKECNEISKEGSLVKEFVWKRKNLVIYGTNELIDITRKNGFIDGPSIYTDLTTFHINYSLPADKIDELWKMSKRHERKMIKEQQNNGL